MGHFHGRNRLAGVRPRKMHGERLCCDIEGIVDTDLGNVAASMAYC